MKEAYIYSGAGNDFVVMDGRSGDCGHYKNESVIAELCSTYGTDGLMILEEEAGYDFRMLYYNSDGSGGMMCGNGGRCIVAFADQLGIVPADGERYRFIAADGEHTAVVEDRKGELKTVALKMIDVHAANRYSHLDGLDSVEGWFLNTGTRHFVIFVDDIEAVDVNGLGARVRRHPVFAPEGVNVNFVQPCEDGIRVRTFEKGVEAETLACGTGIVASAIAAYVAKAAPAVSLKLAGVRNINYLVHARCNDLSVSFNEATGGLLAGNVILTGPAEKVNTIMINQ